MDQRFRRGQRLTAATDFTRCYRQGTRWRTAYFTVHAYRRGEGVARLGLAVGKAIGPAVVRNRVKRRLREIFRLHTQQVPGGYDLFVRAAPASAFASYRQLEATFCDALARLNREESCAPQGRLPQSSTPCCWPA
ncbi:MAG: ribonuclease P protein component [Candidatus Entotheonellia bacterium]